MSQWVTFSTPQLVLYNTDLFSCCCICLYYFDDVVVQITMPSSTTVTATHSCVTRGECYLDVKVYALSEDMDHSEGLCGNFNGERDDDLAGVSNLDKFNLEPIEFIRSFMSVASFLH